MPWWRSFRFRDPDGNLINFFPRINMIGGFGLVSWADRMPEWLAWECFGQGNGALTLDTLRAQIQRLRQRSDIQTGPALDQIGCIILSQPVFLPPDLWIPYQRSVCRKYASSNRPNPVIVRRVLRTTKSPCGLPLPVRYRTHK